MNRPPILVKQLLVLATLIALALTNISAASAQATCDQVVVDSAGVFGSEIQRVGEAAERLAETGAEVRVRTIATYAPSSSLDAFAEQLIGGCATWHDANGDRVSNLLLLIVAIEDRETGAYYGAQWTGALDSEWQAIQTDQMNPLFRDGDFAGGFVAGLDAMNQSIAGAAKPGDNAVPAQPAVPAAVPGEGIGVPGGALGVLLLVLVLGSAAGGLFAYQRERKRRQAAQQQARLAKQGAVEQIIALPQRIKHLETRVTTTVPQVAAEDAAPLNAALGTAQQIANTMLLDYEQLDDHDPERRGLKVDQYNAITAAYQKICATAQEVAQAADELETRLTTLEAAMRQTPQAVIDSRAAIEQATAAIGAVADEGFRTEAAQHILAQAQTGLDEAERALEDRRFIVAARLTATAARRTQEAVDAAQALPQLKRQSEAATSELAQRVERATAQIARGRQTLDEISRIAAQQSWQAVRDYPSEAQQRVAQSQQTLETARGLITMERQAWQQALEQIAVANQRLDEAEQRIAAIITLKHNIDGAIRDAPGLIEQAQAALAAAETYVRQYDADIHDSIWDELRRVGQQLDMARNELRNARPDYLQAIAQVRQVMQTTQELHRQAQAEHEARERLRQQAREAQNQAQWTIAQAYEYMTRHREVRHDTIAALAEAERYMAQAASAAALEAQIEYARRAMMRAQHAHEQAQREVAEAERMRQAALAAALAASRHRSSRGSSRGSSGGGSSWGSSSGGASGWGSSSGGRSSWGSSKKGGGGSTKW
ncbi:MAG TPA: TPM domain-containing protein [Herpetosiphonaceae bacterium]